MQSAYRRRHSTETALLKITNDIYEGFDNRQSTILVALDQSAAFDCIDHSTLISRLQHTFGVTGQVLAWLSSYLQSRQSFVRWDDVSSATSVVAYGVPQGSSLGPLLFSLYIVPLSAVIQSFGLMHHQYADDTQIYISVPNDELAVKVDCLERCTAGVHIWLLSNGLQLNPQKSEVIQFAVGRGRAQVDVDTISISDVDIHPSPAVKSLGVTLDRQLSFDQHVANVCKACYFHTRALRHVRPSLPDDVAKTVACSIVGSRLDYCNSLFAGMSASNFDKLQRVQNTLARVVLRRGKYDHISSALAELHWLPVKQRVSFKVATLAFNVKRENQPSYLRDLLCDYAPSRCLRSSTQDFLRVDRSRTVISSRAFRHVAANSWNSLPSSIRNCNNLCTFKSKLKTHLFKQAFIDCTH